MRAGTLSLIFLIIAVLYCAYLTATLTMTTRIVPPVYHYLDIGRLGRGEVIK